MSKKIGLFDVLNDVNFNKKNIFSESEEAQKAYNVFITNLMLSQHVDCIMEINELNTRGSLSKKWHHDYLFHKLPKRKRFAKLAKPVKEEEIDLIKRTYQYSNERAIEVQDLLTAEDYDRMRERLDTGGRK